MRLRHSPLSRISLVGWRLLTAGNRAFASPRAATPLAPIASDHKAPPALRNIWFQYGCIMTSASRSNFILTWIGNRVMVAESSGRRQASKTLALELGMMNVLKTIESEGC